MPKSKSKSKSLGAFTETRIALEKSGVGLGFTEEYYQREMAKPEMKAALEKIGKSFPIVKYFMTMMHELKIDWNELSKRIDIAKADMWQTNELKVIFPSYKKCHRQ
jgi:hypothetical protein